MSRKPLSFLVAILISTTAHAQSQVGALEHYRIEMVSPGQPNFTPGVELRLTDRFFGGGTAEARITLLEHSSSSTLWERPMLLSLEVERKVSRNEVTFALLVFSIEVRGFNNQGQLIYSRDLPGFQFGDSKSGKWHERLAELPTGLSALSITFIGNYE